MTYLEREIKEDNLEIENVRKSKQYLLPPRLPFKKDGFGKYDLYPTFHLGDGKIYSGITSLIDYCIDQRTVLIDGFVGVFWDRLKDKFKKRFDELNLSFQIHDMEDCLMDEEEIDRLIIPYLGEDNSVWGTKCNGDLSDFLDKSKMSSCQLDYTKDINIVMGIGASLVSWEAPVLYIDLPKNELQYRMRAGSITNLGAKHTSTPEKMYKRFYFIDWPVLNKHKRQLVDDLKIVIDGQRPDELNWTFAEDLKAAMSKMSENVFRVRPWFEPGAWGGQWIRENITGINPEVVNYAWSFELITPENGIVLESGEMVLEVSFDFIMYWFAEKVLGRKNFVRFGYEFPIRFDFLDTIRGGNLSIQCHPSRDYISSRFGENITQDETYYILESDEDSGVYLGFQEDIQPDIFRRELENSNEKKVPLEIGKFVQYFPSKKHDFFLIPNGTIHSSATGNLVLEISATPYIFTFKMYDWLRLDLNGKPRPINIEHAFNNLNFERKGAVVQKELISHSTFVKEGKDWKIVHLPTHREHFYDVYRYEFKNEVKISTEGGCNILMLVEGTSIRVITQQGVTQQFNYAETFVIPAATESFTLINDDKEEVKVLKVFLK